MSTADTTDRDAEPTTPEPLARFWEVVKRMPRYLRLVMGLMRDDRVPLPAKVALTAAGAYAISPIDAIPGFIPVAGQIDDLLVLLVAIRQSLAFCPPGLAAEHLARFDVAEPGIDADIKTTLATARWVAMKTLRAVGRFSAREGKRLFQLSKRAAAGLEDRWRASRATSTPGPS
jgi:uncharacterized membrane protein YkvA (DUF1232 family)